MQAPSLSFRRCTTCLASQMRMLARSMVPAICAQRRASCFSPKLVAKYRLGTQYQRCPTTWLLIFKKPVSLEFLKCLDIGAACLKPLFEDGSVFLQFIIRDHVPPSCVRKSNCQAGRTLAHTPYLSLFQSSFNIEVNGLGCVDIETLRMRMASWWLKLRGRALRERFWSFRGSGDGIRCPRHARARAGGWSLTLTRVDSCLYPTRLVKFPDVALPGRLLGVNGHP